MQAFDLTPVVHCTRTRVQGASTGHTGAAAAGGVEAPQHALCCRAAALMEKPKAQDASGTPRRHKEQDPEVTRSSNRGTFLNPRHVTQGLREGAPRPCLLRTLLPVLSAGLGICTL